MADVIFYEKPGCRNNTRQKRLLAKAGHTVFEKNLLTEDWVLKKDYLRSFFGTLPVIEWFNQSAPAIKEGQLNPSALSEEQAIALMIESPILIRRPLMEAAQRQHVGFDEAIVASWLGLEAELSKSHGDLEQCPNTHKVSDCQHE